MRRVVLESPYAGDVQRNLAYARRAMRHALELGDAPLASHALYTQRGVLDDGDPAERDLGMRAGFAWGAAADLCAVYVDRGVSAGMLRGVEAAVRAGVPVRMRSVGRGPYLGAGLVRACRVSASRGEAGAAEVASAPGDEWVWFGEPSGCAEVTLAVRAEVRALRGGDLVGSGPFDAVLSWRAPGAGTLAARARDLGSLWRGGGPGFEGVAVALWRWRAAGDDEALGHLAAGADLAGALSAAAAGAA